MSTLRWGSVAVALLVMSSGAAGAQGKSREHGKKARESEAALEARVVFRGGDRAVYRDYFASHQMVAQPLPPGIAKRLARGKPLPPGIAKRMVPADLIARGPALDRDVSLAIVGDAVVATRAGVVIDILAGVFR